MMSLKETYEIAKKEYENGKLIECKDLGNKYAFMFGPEDLDENEMIVDEPYITVDKENGTIDYLTVPPIQNLEILKRGTNIDVKQVEMSEQSQAGKLFNLDLGD